MDDAPPERIWAEARQEMLGRRITRAQLEELKKRRIAFEPLTVRELPLRSPLPPIPDREHTETPEP